MTDNTELKRLADELIAANDLFNESPQDNEVGDVWSLANDRFTEAASPESILALIAESERLQGCEDVLRQLASHVGAGGYNAPEVDPETFARKIMDGINILNDPLAQLVIKKGEQIDQLRAEVAGLKTGYEAYERVNAELKAEVEGLRKDRTDWQAECLKRGFEYVRESDDHYVLADVPEMADLLGSMLGVEVRSKENDGYEEANSQLSEQIEGLINTIHSQESMRKDAERWRFVRNPTATGSPFAVWSERTNLFLGKFADEAIDAAMSQGEQS